MADPLEDLLRLVAEGRLTPEEAAPIIEALGLKRSPAPGAAAAGAAAGSTRGTGGGGSRAGTGSPDAASGPAGGRQARIHIEVRDEGRIVVNLQVPAFLSELAQTLPGIPAAYAAQVRSALQAGVRGRIVDITDEDGSGISITVE